jgi:hypothetical protein
LLIGTLYFGALAVVLKYQVIFVMVPNYEGGGRFWYSLYHYTMTGLMTSVITMIGYLSIKEGSAQVPLMVPLAGVILYTWYYTEQEFKTLSGYLPYSDAVSADITPEKQKEFDDEHRRYLESLSMRSASPNLLLGASRRPQSPSMVEDSKMEESTKTAAANMNGTESRGATPVILTDDAIIVENGTKGLATRASSSENAKDGGKQKNKAGAEDECKVGRDRPDIEVDGSGNSDDRPSLFSPKGVKKAVSRQFKGVARGVSQGTKSIASLAQNGIVMQTPFASYKARALNVDSFDRKYCYQKNIKAENPIKPYPYRVNGVPLLDDNGQMNRMYYSLAPEKYGILDVDEYDLERGGGVGAGVTVGEAEHYPPGAVDMTRPEDGIAMTHVSSRQQPRLTGTDGSIGRVVSTPNNDSTYSFPNVTEENRSDAGSVAMDRPQGRSAQRRGSSLQEIRQAARRDSFSDREDDGEHCALSGDAESISSSASSSVQYEDLSKKVHLVGLEAFRRHAPYPVNAPKAIPKRKRKRTAKAVGSMVPQSSVEAGEVIRGMPKKRGSTIMDIQKFISGEEHSDFSDEEGDADTEDEGSLHGSSRGISGSGVMMPNGIRSYRSVKKAESQNIDESTATVVPASSHSLLGSLFGFDSHPGTTSNTEEKLAVRDPAENNRTSSSVKSLPEKRHSIVGSLFGSLGDMIGRKSSATSLNSSEHGLDGGQPVGAVEMQTLDHDFNDGVSENVHDQNGGATKNSHGDSSAVAALTAKSADEEDAVNESTMTLQVQTMTPSSDPQQFDIDNDEANSSEASSESADGSTTDEETPILASEEPPPPPEKAPSPRPSIFGGFRFSRAPAPAPPAAVTIIQQPEAQSAQQPPSDAPPASSPHRIGTASATVHATPIMPVANSVTAANSAVDKGAAITVTDTTVASEVDPSVQAGRDPGTTVDMAPQVTDVAASSTTVAPEDDAGSSIGAASGAHTDLLSSPVGSDTVPKATREATGSPVRGALGRMSGIFFGHGGSPSGSTPSPPGSQSLPQKR